MVKRLYKLASHSVPTQVWFQVDILNQGRLAATAVANERDSKLMCLFNGGQFGSQRKRGKNTRRTGRWQTRGIAWGQFAEEALGCLAKVANHDRGAALATILDAVEDDWGCNHGEAVSAPN